MRFKFILIFCMFLFLMINIVVGQGYYRDYIFENDSLDNGNNWNVGSCTVSGGALSCGSGQVASLVHELPGNSVLNWSCEGVFKATDPGSAEWYFIFHDANTTGTSDWMFGVEDLDNIRIDGSGSSTNYPISGIASGVYERWRFTRLTNDSISFFINDSLILNAPHVLEPLFFSMQLPLNRGETTSIDHLSCWIDTPDIDLVPDIDIIVPLNNTKLNQFPLTFTINVSDDGEESICYLRNESVFFDNGTFEIGVVGNLTFNYGSSDLDQNFLFNITCYDEENNTGTALLNITLDTIDPVLNVSLPLNNSIYYKNITEFYYNSSCTDLSLYSFNMTMSNFVTSDIITSVQNNTYGTEMTLKGIVDIGALTSGLYKLLFTCKDPHTAKSSKILGYEKNIVDHEIDYLSTDTNRIIISSDGSDLKVCDFGTYSLYDREVFWYDFESCNTGEPTPVNDFIFNIKDKDGVLTYLPDSDYNGHFLTKDNYITFHIDGEDDYNIKNPQPNKYEITITSENRYFVFDNSVGGLNSVEEFYIVNITEQGEAPPTPGEAYSVTQCYFVRSSSSVEDALDNFMAFAGIIFFILVAFGLVLLGKYFKHAIVGFAGSMTLLLTSLYVFPCSALIGLVLSLVALWLGWYFVSKGWGGNL